MQICGGAIIALCLGCLWLPASFTLLFMQPWWHALFLTDSSSSFDFPSQLFQQKIEVVRYFMLVSANHRHATCIFFCPLPLSFLICIQFVRHVMVMPINCASCTVYFCPLTYCFPVFPFSQICVYSCSTLGFQPLTKANDRASTNDIRVIATCLCKNA